VRRDVRRRVPYRELSYRARGQGTDRGCRYRSASVPAYPRHQRSRDALRYRVIQASRVYLSNTHTNNADFAKAFAPRNPRCLGFWIVKEWHRVGRDDCCKTNFSQILFSTRP
jgi:hypothetical protein